MELTADEKAILAGDKGDILRDALRLQYEIGKFWGAKRFISVSNVHMMGDIEVLGDAGKSFIDYVAENKAQTVCPTSTNARCVDFGFAEQLGQNLDEVNKETKIIQSLRDIGITTVDTCINYQTVYQPHFGEHIAWGDTGTVIYANSIFGARTNFESGPSALAAALTGRTAEYGFHLDWHRKGTLHVKIEFDPKDFADFGVIGKIAGEANQNYFSVPVFTGFENRQISSDELKHLGASLASYGSMGMFHIAGITPEARTFDEAFGDNKPTQTISITAKDIKNVYDSYDNGGAPLNLVVFSAPQLSIHEIKYLASLFKNRRVKDNTHVFITTSNGVKSHAEQLKYLQTLKEAGVLILEGVCFYILQNLPQMRKQNGWHNIVTNSAKLANIIKAHKFNPILKRTQECVDIATKGI
ncbi:MAG: aconitase X [Campylobacteraceae bacterium]